MIFIIDEKNGDIKPCLASEIDDKQFKIDPVQIDWNLLWNNDLGNMPKLNDLPGIKLPLNSIDG